MGAKHYHSLLDFVSINSASFEAMDSSSSNATFSQEPLDSLNPDITRHRRMTDWMGPEIRSKGNIGECHGQEDSIRGGKNQNHHPCSQFHLVKCHPLTRLESWRNSNKALTLFSPFFLLTFTQVKYIKQLISWRLAGLRSQKEIGFVRIFCQIPTCTCKRWNCVDNFSTLTRNRKRVLR